MKFLILGFFLTIAATSFAGSKNQNGFCQDSKKLLNQVEAELNRTVASNQKAEDYEMRLREGELLMLRSAISGYCNIK